jgi:hypothetical protein
MASTWPSLEPLLVDWHRRARESQHVHYAAESHYARLNYWYGVPSIALSAIVGTSIFASLETQVDLRSKILVGTISIVAAVLSALQTYLRFSEWADKHRQAASGYAAVRRSIEEVLALPESERGPVVRVVDRIRRRLDSLASSSPAAPPSLRHRELGRLKSKSPYFAAHPTPSSDPPAGHPVASGG